MKKKNFRIILTLLCIIAFSSCEQQIIELDSSSLNTEHQQRKELPEHKQVQEKIPPERKPLSKEEYEQIVISFQAKSEFSLNYNKDCLNYNFSACVPSGADIYDFFLFKDDNLYAYVGTTYGPFNNCLD